MTAEFGLFFLILALLAALLQAAFLWPAPALKRWVGPCLPSAAWLQCLCITLAFAMLMMLRVDNDFSVLNVIQHSNRTLPLLYKIAGTWGNHEGSMLLFALVLAGFGAVMSVKNNSLAIATQAAIGAGVLLFILFTSNPFARTFPPTADGEALNPLLQDFALSMHPPMLYLGYVGFSAVFSFAVAAMLEGKIERGWAESVHPWILAAWSALTLGIGLGSWWAYRVLGWGGFWFWDPVENASLLPWLSGTALLHANIVLKKRGSLKQWVLLLSIITFGLSLLGTFLVRSGVLISVHSFASDPTRGYFILAFFILAIGGALALFAMRAGQLRSDETMLPLSREGMIVINNLFLLTACATVLLGTLYPMLAEIMSGEKLTVGPPYFNATFLPLIAIPLIFAGLTPFMPWKQARFRESLRAARPALMATLAVIVFILAFVDHEKLLAAAGFGLAAWLALASLQWVIIKRSSKGAMAVFIAHLGVAVIVAGVTGATLFKQESERWMSVGDSMDIAGYHIIYAKISAADAPNYHGQRGNFIVTDKAGNPVATLTPEHRTYDIRNSSTSIASIHSAPAYDLYAVIGEASQDGKRTSVRIYYNPVMGFIWGGFVLMFMGGVTAIMRKHYGS